MGLLKFHGEVESGYDWDDKPFSSYRFGEYHHILIDTNLNRQSGDTITWKIQMPPKDNFNPKEGREPGLLVSARYDQGWEISVATVDGTPNWVTYFQYDDKVGPILYVEAPEGINLISMHEKYRY